MNALFLFTASMLLTPGPQAPQPPQHRQYWSGSLVNAACRAEHPKKSCLVGKKTSTFGVVTSDAKFYKLDQTGNQAAPGLLSKSPNKTADLSIGVFGTLTGDTIKVEVLQIP